jgi:hypothetical protein
VLWLGHLLTVAAFQAAVRELSRGGTKALTAATKALEARAQHIPFWPPRHIVGELLVPDALGPDAPRVDPALGELLALLEALTRPSGLGEQSAAVTPAVADTVSQGAPFWWTPSVEAAVRTIAEAPDPPTAATLREIAEASDTRDRFQSVLRETPRTRALRLLALLTAAR